MVNVNTISSYKTRIGQEPRTLKIPVQMLFFLIQPYQGTKYKWVSLEVILYHLILQFYHQN